MQRVHLRLARRKRRWPSFPLPRDRGSVTARQVMAAPPGPERDCVIDEWCASVWAAFSDSHRAVATLLRRCGIV